MDDYLSTAMTAQRLGIGTSRVRQLALAGILKGEHFGHGWVFPVEEVQRVAEQRRAGREVPIIDRARSSS